MNFCLLQAHALLLLTALALAGCGQTLVDGIAEDGSATTLVASAGEPSSVASSLFALTTENESPMTLEHSEFGKTPDGQVIELYTLKNTSGLTVKLINYGATVVSVETPDSDGKVANIALGHQSLENWLANPCYFGCTVGRFGNRIAGGVFGINDNIYTLAKNDGANHLHGGVNGFHKMLWTAEGSTAEDSASVVFTRTSPDGEENYPGNLQVSVTYTLTETNELKIHYTATTDKPTVVNLTNHTYWNLTGNAAEQTVLDHELTLNCNLYLPVNEQLIPTGDMAAVADTPMNFVAAHKVGDRIADVPGGYDHCFIVNRTIDGLTQAARVYEPNSGRVMEVFTTEPGIQFYSGNFLNGQPANGGFGKHHGFCLETQHYPDSPNQPHFPTTRLNPGETYETTTVHKFSVYKQAR
ncbi:MAG: aldose epimerase family protein [Fuerstiella sp.]